MNEINYEFSPRLQKLVDLGESGTNIIHGELKNLMVETEKDLDEVDPSDETYYYLQGVLDAYTRIYQLTYDLSFAGAK